jgi:hypothetical protein
MRFHDLPDGAIFRLTAAGRELKKRGDSFVTPWGALVSCNTPQSQVIWICAYCGSEVEDQFSRCCGEVGHTELRPSNDEAPALQVDIEDAYADMDLHVNPPDYDPTPWCNACGARRREQCKCGPIADNE